MQTSGGKMRFSTAWLAAAKGGMDRDFRLGGREACLEIAIRNSVQGKRQGRDGA